MQTPPPVSGQSYPTSGTSSERSNYLRGGLAFTGAYTDNALGSVGGQPGKRCELLHRAVHRAGRNNVPAACGYDYAPGFTFYQKTSARNEQDQNASINLQYRLSPHVTFSARDSFQKSSNVFNQPFFGSAAPVSGGTQKPNFSVIAPVATTSQQYRKCGHQLAVRCKRHGRSQRNIHQPALSGPGRGSRPVRLEFPGRVGLLLVASLENALHRCNVSVSATDCVSDATARARRRLTRSFSSTRLYATSQFSLSVLRRAATF